MRVRLLKPETFKDEHLAEVSLAARFLFMGLWTLADRDGRLEDRPKWIRAELLPYDAAVDVDGLLNELANPKAFIVRYQVDGHKYIQLTNFLKHQKPHPREAASVLPAPRTAQGKPRPAKEAPSLPVSDSDSDSDRDQGRDVEAPVTPAEPKAHTGTPDGTPLSNPSGVEPTATAPRRLTPQALGIRVDPANFAQVQLSHDLTALVCVWLRDLGSEPKEPKQAALELLHDISTTPAGKRIETLDLRRVSRDWAAISSHAAYKLAREVYGVELDPATARATDTPVAASGSGGEGVSKPVLTPSPEVPKKPALTLTVAPGACPVCSSPLRHTTEGVETVLRCDQETVPCEWAAVWKAVAA